MNLRWNEIRKEITVYIERTRIISSQNIFIELLIDVFWDEG